MAMTHSPGFLRLVADAKTRIREIDVAGYKQMLAEGQDHVLVDVREDTEWAQGHVKRAVHLGRGVIERDIEIKYPDPSVKLVLYCGGGFRSALVADSLRTMGYVNTLSIDGGWRSLKDSGIELA